MGACLDLQESMATPVQSSAPPNSCLRSPLSENDPNEMKKTLRNPRRPHRQDRSPYPKGWNRRRVQKLIDYYDHQTDQQAIVEAEAAYADTKSTMMQIPNELVPKVQKLLGKRAG